MEMKVEHIWERGNTADKDIVFINVSVKIVGTYKEAKRILETYLTHEGVQIKFSDE